MNPRPWLFESELNPEAYAERLWDSMNPARPLEECPGAFELAAPAGERGRWSMFGVDPGEELAWGDALLAVRIRRSSAPGLLLGWIFQARLGKSIYVLDDGGALLTPAFAGASLIVTVWDARTRRLAEGVQVRAR